ncbi:MAG: hypothetical protein V4509_05245 [Patescibacteria group bacterium]
MNNFIIGENAGYEGIEGNRNIIIGDCIEDDFAGKNLGKVNNIFLLKTRMGEAKLKMNFLESFIIHRFFRKLFKTIKLRDNRSNLMKLLDLLPTTPN